MSSPAFRCLLTREFWDQDLEYLRTHVTSDMEFVIPKEYATQALIEAASTGIDVLLGDVPALDVLDASKGVKLLQIPWTGIDQIDFDLLRRYNFQVCNSHSNAVSVAELGIALLLSCMKQIPSHHFAMQRGNWRRPGADDSVMPEVLSGKNAGLIGYGAIGRKIARMLSGFGVRLQVLASEARQDSEIAVQGPDQLDTLCSRCDVLMISAPLTPETRGMIGKRQFGIMKNNTYIINVSRSAIIDEETFYDALKDRRIAGAGVDVWYQYPHRGDSFSRASRFPFETLDNVIMSPHRGGMVRGELPHLADVVENLNHFAKGNPLMNCVDLIKKY